MTTAYSTQTYHLCSGLREECQECLNLEKIQPGLDISVGHTDSES